MQSEHQIQAVVDFLGSAQVFTSTVNDLMAGQLKEVSTSDVTYSQLKLLKMVAATGGYSVSSLAQFMGVSTAAASRAVDRLVRRGLIDRAEASDDRRAVQLSLTDAGCELLSRYDKAANAALKRVFASLSQDEMQQASDLLDRLSIGLVEQANDADEVCFRCGIHFRERCLLRQVRSRSCLYHRQQPSGVEPCATDDGGVNRPT
jgi:DNA-binding MarR family transcriptional regulator